MGVIVQVVQLANTFNRSVNNAVGNELIRQAEGLVIARIGTHSPWPMVAETVVLAAAGRPLRNPKGAKANTTDSVSTQYPDEDLGVYLTETDKDRLDEWLAEQQTNSIKPVAVGTLHTPTAYPSVRDCDYYRYGSIL